MTTEALVIGLVRLLSALPVLRWPLAGGIIAIAFDLSDLVLMNALDLGGLGDYQQFDKITDQFYMVTFLIVALRWHGLARRIAIVLFALRLVGVVAFELTGDRLLLFGTPNVFELWFLFVAARDHFRPEYEITGRRAAAWLGALFALKLGQEYLLHVDRRLDDYNLFETLRALRDAMLGAR